MFKIFTVLALFNAAWAQADSTCRYIPIANQPDAPAGNPQDFTYGVINQGQTLELTVLTWSPNDGTDGPKAGTKFTAQKKRTAYQFGADTSMRGFSLKSDSEVTINNTDGEFGYYRCE